MESLVADSAEGDIYEAVTSLTQLRELSRHLPGRSVYAKLVSRVYSWKETHSVPSVDSVFEQHKQYTLSKLRRKREGGRRGRPAADGEQPEARAVDAEQSGSEREAVAEERNGVSHASQHTDASHPPRSPPRSRAAQASRATPHQSIVRDVLSGIQPEV